MPIDKRHKNRNWQLPTGANGAIESWQYVSIAVLMDLRDELRAGRSLQTQILAELQSINRTLKCHETQAIPRILRRISANTAKPRKPKGGAGAT